MDEIDTLHTEHNFYAKYVTYSGLFNEMTEAMTFVMAHIDDVTKPSIEISAEECSWDIIDDQMCEPYVKYRTHISGYEIGKPMSFSRGVDEKD